MKQASRLWVKRYTRPRKPDGTWAPGFQQWIRDGDGQSRWVFWPSVEQEKLRDAWIASDRPLPNVVVEPNDVEPRTSARTFDDESLRHLVVLLIVVAVAALLAIFVK